MRGIHHHPSCTGGPQEPAGVPPLARARHFYRVHYDCTHTGFLLISCGGDAAGGRRGSDARARACCAGPSSQGGVGGRGLARHVEEREAAPHSSLPGSRGRSGCGCGDGALAWQGAGGQDAVEETHSPVRCSPLRRRPRRRRLVAATPSRPRRIALTTAPPCRHRACRRHAATLPPPLRCRAAVPPLCRHCRTFVTAPSTTAHPAVGFTDPQGQFSHSIL